MSYDQASNEYFMQQALKEAKQAYFEGEVPIGAALAKDGQLLVSDHNRKEQLGSATAHAEKLVIERANKLIGNWRLTGCQLFVTIEPCVMCCGAIIQSRLPELFYGARDPKFGAVASLYHVLEDSRANHFVSVQGGLMAEESASLMQDFFRKLRES